MDNTLRRTMPLEITVHIIQFACLFILTFERLPSMMDMIQLPRQSRGRVPALSCCPPRQVLVQVGIRWDALRVGRTSVSESQGGSEAPQGTPEGGASGLQAPETSSSASSKSCPDLATQRPKVTRCITQGLEILVLHIWYFCRAIEC